MHHEQYEPNLCVTGLGSLGFHIPRSALQLIERACPECPHWPQLPQRDPREMMINQFIEGWGFLDQAESETSYWAWPAEIPVSALEQVPPLPPRELAMGLYAFAESLAQGGFAEARFLKGQMTGPFTLGHYVFAHGRMVLEQEAYREALLHWAARAARAQVALLQQARPGVPVLLYLDDPLFIGSLNRNVPLPAEQACALMERLIGEIRGESGPDALRIGLHLSENQGDWSRILALPIDVVSLDATACLTAFMRSGETLIQYVERGGWISWGLVRGGEDATDPTVGARARVFQFLMDLVLRWDDDLKRLEPLIRQSLVTPATGMGLLSPDACERQLEECRQVAELLRDGYQQTLRALACAEEASGAAETSPEEIGS